MRRFVYAATLILALLVVSSAANAFLEKETFRLGETKTYTVQADEYDVVLTFLSNPASADMEAQFAINGKQSEPLKEDDTFTHEDMTLRVDDLRVSNNDAEAEVYLSGPGELERVDDLEQESYSLIEGEQLDVFIDERLTTIVQVFVSDPVSGGRSTKFALDGKLTQELNEGESVKTDHYTLTVDKISYEEERDVGEVVFTIEAVQISGAETHCSALVNEYCGVDGNTYPNKCVLVEAGTEISYHAPCRGGAYDACYASGGEWKLFSNTCVDSCSAVGSNGMCGQAMTEGCDCGPNQCWDGERCVDNPDGDDELNTYELYVYDETTRIINGERYVIDWVDHDGNEWVTLRFNDHISDPLGVGESEEIEDDLYVSVDEIMLEVGMLAVMPQVSLTIRAESMEMPEHDDPEVDLAHYPTFLFEDGEFVGKIVIGEDAPTTDVASAVDIAADLQAGVEDPIEAGIAVLDSAIGYDDHRVVAIGSVCDNGYIEDVLTLHFDYHLTDMDIRPYQMCEYLTLRHLTGGERLGVIALVDTGDHTAVLVTGETSEEASWAADVLASRMDCPMSADGGLQPGAPCRINYELEGSFCTVEPNGDEYDVTCFDHFPRHEVDFPDTCPNVHERVRMMERTIFHLADESTVTLVHGEEEFDVYWDGSVLEVKPSIYPVMIDGTRYDLREDPRLAVEVLLGDDIVAKAYIRKAYISEDCDVITIQLSVVDDDATKISFELDEGWNLITLPGEVQRFAYSGDEKLLGYVYVDGEYLTLSQARDELKTRFAEYLATHAFWVYAYSDERLQAWVEPIEVDALEVEPGWNLLPIIAPFAGESLEQLAPGCDLMSAYLWDSEEQEWEAWGLATRFRSSMVGDGFLLRANQACTLEGGLLAPPSFPTDDDMHEDHSSTQGRAYGQARASEAIEDARERWRVRVEEVPRGLRVKPFENPLWSDEQRRLVNEMVDSLEEDGLIEVDDDGVITVQGGDE